MRVIISAGGTGGHIYPAISIINKIKEKDKNSEFLYIGTTDRMEAKIVPELGINYLGIEMKGLKRNLKKSAKAIYLFFKAINKCKKAIKDFNPDLVIGVGGYITTPVIYSAKKLGIKTIIHEQNSIPGKSNKFLSKFADSILLSLPGSKEYFKNNKTYLTGNPRSEEAYNAKCGNKKELGLDKNKKLVLIVMGSLGSLTINNELKNIVSKFKDKDYEVLLVTGNNYYESFKVLDIPNNVKIVPFLNNMLNILKYTDLIVTRAGASTIAEITAIGLPSILVPSPYVANNHQFYNAMELVNNKASLLLEEKDFNSDNLINKIDYILNDKELYQTLHEGALKLGINNSNEKIYEIIRDMVK